MSIHPKLVMVPNPLLREKCAEVLEPCEQIDELVGTMKEVIIACRQFGIDTVSIAAPQVGVKLRVFIIDSPAIQMVAINPIITKRAGEQKIREGCLSFPRSTHYLMTRANIVKFRYTDEYGFTHTQKFHDLYAAIVQHEIDHLNGILMDDDGIPV